MARAETGETHNPPGYPRVVVIDDDLWTRNALTTALDADPRVRFVRSGTQSEAADWPDTVWDEVDVAFIDVHDESTLDQAGTDLYTGIEVLEVVRDLPIVTVTLAPTIHNPLLGLRLVEAGADYVYLRREIQSPDSLVNAILKPDPAHAAKLHADPHLQEHGVNSRSRPNLAVAAYKASTLYGRLTASSKLAVLRRSGISKRKTGQLTDSVAKSGFSMSPSVDGRMDKPPTWRQVRLYLLKLLGRENVEERPLPPDDTV